MSDTITQDEQKIKSEIMVQHYDDLKGAVANKTMKTISAITAKNTEGAVSDVAAMGMIHDVLGAAYEIRTVFEDHRSYN